MKLALLLLLSAFALLPLRALAVERMEDLPPELQGVGIFEKLNGSVPLDLEFKNEDGEVIKLRDAFGKDLPVILTLNYSDCPMLCSLQLDAMVDTLKELDWVAGREFRIITVSINPAEIPARAKLTKQKYAKEYGKLATSDGWRFLVSPKEENVKQLADAVGFGYRYNEERKEYMHAAALMILTPSGKISRYLTGVQYERTTLRMSLLEAAEGKIGTTMDQILLYCYHYDPSTKRYSVAAMNLMRIGALLTVLVLAATLGGFWLKERVRNKTAGTPPAGETKEA